MAKLSDKQREYLEAFERKGELTTAYYAFRIGRGANAGRVFEALEKRGLIQEIEGTLRYAITAAGRTALITSR